MIFEQAPQEYSKDYIDRLVREVNLSISQINEVGIRSALPENPKVGKIYFIPPDDESPGGYWVFLSDEWYTVDLTKAVIDE